MVLYERKPGWFLYERKPGWFLYERKPGWFPLIGRAQAPGLLSFR